MKLSDAQIYNIVRRSYQYVALYNVNNKQAKLAGGWNDMLVDIKLEDHTLTIIARPNSDTLYVAAMLDLRKEPVILEAPAIDSRYVSLMVTGYDHYSGSGSMNFRISTRAAAPMPIPEKSLSPHIS